MPPRLFAGRDGLGKKNDDFRPASMKSPMGMDWQQRRLPRRNLKRVALGLVVLIGLYFFFKNMPTDLPPQQRPQWTHSSDFQGQPPPPKPATAEGLTQKPAPEKKPQMQPEHSFNGPIKFYELASTLHEAGRMGGTDPVNPNVLFAAASLKSASILLPIACEMAIRERNNVHFALFGRDDISMDILKAVNGVTRECKIIFHDARPDFSAISTDYRMEVSCSAGFNHVNNYVHPQATFVDASGLEEIFFLKGLKDQAMNLGRTVIELPENAEQTMMWSTYLDSNSLGAWNKVNIDILIHAPPASSGSLIRLLESLKKADYFSSAPPHLTIELPHEVDEPTRRYIENFKWPPKADQNHGNLLAIHHRILQHGLSQEENSIRFLEGFWPSNPFTSHILLLSPQAQLSPLFYHYLKYNVLEYKYASIELVHQNLLGISLDLPSTHLNDSAGFIPPPSKAGDGLSPFLWQAPNSNAALFFGEKWVELHDLVSKLLVSQHTLPIPTTLNEKQVSKTYPSWLEHILKLARARGYWMLYPNFESDNLVTLHNELYQLPEEYSQAEESPTSGDLTADPAAHSSLKHREKSLVTKSLLTILPKEGELPKIWEMPFLSWDGTTVSAEDLEAQAADYSKIFRHEIGGCEIAAVAKPRQDLSASDLFCLGDAKMDGKTDVPNFMAASKDTPVGS